MHRPEVKTDENVLKKQMAKSIEQLKAESQAIQGKIKDLNAQRSEIEKYLDAALREEREKVGKALDDAKKIQKSADAIRDQHQKSLSALNDRVENFREFSEEEVINLAAKMKKVEADAKRNLDRKESLDSAAVVLKKWEEAVSVKEKNADNSAQKIEGAGKELATKMNAIDAERAAVNGLLKKNAEEREAIKKLALQVENGREDNLRFATALDEKEKQLISLKKEIEKARGGIQDDIDEVKKKKEDVLVLAKQNQAEATRLKALEKELNNRESKISQREKLFKQNLGG